MDIWLSSFDCIMYFWIEQYFLCYWELLTDTNIGWDCGVNHNHMQVYAGPDEGWTSRIIMLILFETCYVDM